MASPRTSQPLEVAAHPASCQPEVADGWFGQLGLGNSGSESAAWDGSDAFDDDGEEDESFEQFLDCLDGVFSGENDELA
jgi:hypothetical protein